MKYIFLIIQINRYIGCEKIEMKDGLIYIYLPYVFIKETLQWYRLSAEYEEKHFAHILGF